jgi:hypothetical protein
MIGLAAERLMELAVGGLTGAAWGEKSVPASSTTIETESAITPRQARLGDVPVAEEAALRDDKELQVAARRDAGGSCRARGFRRSAREDGARVVKPG